LVRIQTGSLDGKPSHFERAFFVWEVSFECLLTCPQHPLLRQDLHDFLINLTQKRHKYVTEFLRERKFGMATISFIVFEHHQKVDGSYNVEFNESRFHLVIKPSKPLCFTYKVHFCLGRYSPLHTLWESIIV
jgi:hypothetical protein